MILDVDHIALNVADLPAAAQWLSGQGYQQVFDAQHKPNLPSKAPLLHQTQPTHHLRLMRRAQAWPIELIDHGYLHPSRGAFVPLIGDSPSSLGSALVPVEFDRLTTTTWGSYQAYALGEPSQTAASTHLIGFAVAVTDLEQSIAFWGLLGFKPLNSHAQGAELGFRSLLGGTSYRLWLLKSDEQPTLPMLDDAGFACLALVTNALERVLKRLKERGYTTTERCTFQPDQTPLEIAFARGPSGELVELIAVARNTSN